MSLNRFKALEYKELDDKENQHNEHEDLVSHSPSQPQDRDRVQSQEIVKKSTSQNRELLQLPFAEIPL